MDPTMKKETGKGLDSQMKELDCYFETCFQSTDHFSLIWWLMGIRMPLMEIRHIWLSDYSLLKHAANTFKSGVKEGIKPSEKGEGAQEHGLEEALIMVADYLLQAGQSRNLADAWSFVNLASAYLVKGVQKEDIVAASIGFISCDKSLSKKAQARLKDMEENIEEETILINQEKDSQEMISERDSLFARLNLRSYIWDVSNRRIRLRIGLWRRVSFILVVSLILALIIAYQATHDLRIFNVPFLGALGGCLSATLTARKSMVDAVSYRQISWLVVVRVLLGAAGAFVVYLVLFWPDVFSKDLVKAIETDEYLYLVLGIASGFSERLFVGALEKISDKLSINSEDDELATETKIES